MDGNERPASPDLSRLNRLRDAPEKHHLFFALRLIEAAFRDRPRLGRSVRPKQDAVRIGQDAELAFPPRTITSFEMPGENPGKLRQAAFGLFGPSGPLPIHITEFARDRRRNHRDPTMNAFADVFHHRLGGLFYRAWVAGEPAPSFDRDDEDPFADRVASLAGLNAARLRDRDAMPDLAKLYFAGVLAQGPRNAEGLLAILRSFFDAPVDLVPFVGSWLSLEQMDRWKLGHAALGRGCSMGLKVWSRQEKVRLVIGPLSREQYDRMLPGRGSLKRLAAIMRTYLGDVMDWELNLVLQEKETPRMQLGDTSGGLGLTSWTGERGPKDAGDLILTPSEVAAWDDRAA